MEKKTIALSLLDRLIFASILKKEGSFEEMIISKDIKKKIEITQEEVRDYGIQTISTGGLQFNEKGSNSKLELEFTELEFSACKEGLKKLQDEKKLTEDHIDLYKFFVG